MSLRFSLGTGALLLAASTAVFAQMAPNAKPERIRGEVVSLDGNTLKVHRRSGDTVDIPLAQTATISAVKALQLSDVKSGEFIGTAATTGTDGKLTATEVVVFPESARGTGEGHYAWDLGPNSSMTNANVDSIVQGTSGRDLKLSYKGGANTVTVPPNVPIVTFVPATKADLVAGKKVFVVATHPSPGALEGQRVVVEKDGVAPPM